MSTIKNALFIALVACQPLAAHAYDTLLLQPSRTSCKVVPGVERGSLRCDVIYDGLQIHEGRNMSESVANGDCVKCNSVIEQATEQGRKIMMFRGYYRNEQVDWQMDGFFQVNPDEEKTCRP